MYSLEGRLAVYEKALEKYRESKIKWSYVTCWGFCYYLYSKGHPSNIKENFPELWKTRPIHFRIFGGSDNYWFFDGWLGPRIRCLKRAIKDCRKQLYANRD